MDQRVITSPEGESFLLPAAEDLSASAIALVEPWACVEDSYAVKERATIKADGQMLVVADEDIDSTLFAAYLARFGKPAAITSIGKSIDASDIDVEVIPEADVSQVQDAAFDDVIYFGAEAETIESLFAKIGPSGLLNVVQCGKKFGREITAAIGRVHYGNIRIVGTTTNDPAESMQYIPASGEIRKGDNIDVIGAGGPMGVMHVIRNICQGVEGITVYAGDLDDERLGILSRIAQPMADQRGISYKPYNPTKNAPDVAFDYTALMAPVPKLVSNAIKVAAPNAIINIFAGIPAHVTGQIDLDACIEKHVYFIGTSGSVLEDMKAVLAKVESRTLETDISVAAVTGLDGAVEGIRAVEKGLIPGKILVYPACEGLGLVTLDKLHETLPDVAAKLDNGLWNLDAENALLAHFST